MTRYQLALRRFIESYLGSLDLGPSNVSLSFQELEDGQDMILISPNIDGAATVRIYTPSTAIESSISYVFAGEANSPIEVDGSINSERDDLDESVRRELTEILDLVSAGEVYLELDTSGNVSDSWIPDSSTVDIARDERHPHYRPWAARK